VAYAMSITMKFTVVLMTNHTRTVVRECFKGDEASQWKRPKFDPRHTKTP